MADATSVSRNRLRSRRQQLQNRRRVKGFKSLWRFLATASLAGGTIWLGTLPQWTMGKHSPLEITGNHLLGNEQIRQWLPLKDSQAVWQLSAQTLVARLEATPPIASAQITRQILPPKLVVKVRERQPVASAIAANEIGYLDEEGTFIPQSYYLQKKTLPATPLKVIGYRELYRQQWQQLYPSLVGASMKITEVDWRNPGNPILKTELGKVYLGSNLALVSQQLEVLAQMRDLSAQMKSDRLIYIDLSNPNSPTIEIKQQKAQQKVTSKVKKPLRNH
jgi:cell division protein FtsQ